MADVDPRQTRRRFHRGTLLAVIPPIVAAVWCGAWILLAGRVGAGFDEWVAAEAKAGRQWTCPARHVGGFPFAVKLRCERPTYRGEVVGRTADGIAEGLVAGISLGHPTRLRVRLKGPFNLRSEQEDFDLAATWDSLELFIDDITAAKPHGGLDAARLAVTLQSVAQGEQNMRAAALSASATPADTGPQDAAFTFAAQGATFPTLADLPGLDGPADATGSGILFKADLVREPTKARLEAWRLAGGSLRLAALDVSKGAFHGSAEGGLTLDDAHRPAGILNASLAGFEPIAARFGIPIAGARLGGLLSTLLGGGKAPPAQAGAVSMKLLLADGRLSVGPFATGVRLDPWY